MLKPIKSLEIDLTPTQKFIINICRERGRISKAEIAKQAGIGSGTVTNACKDLLALNLIRENDSELLGKRGKPSSPIDINPYGAFTFGVAFQITSIEITLANFNGTILDFLSVEHVDQDDALETIDRIYYNVMMLKKKHHLNNARILGMGVSISGPFVYGTQMIHTVRALSHWRNIDFRSVFGAKFSFPVWIDNDCNVAAVGEYLSEHWKVNHMVLIDIGRGIGAGVIIDGKPHTGSQRNAGELGAYFDRMYEGDRPSIWVLLEKLKTEYKKDFLVSDIPSVNDPVVNSWINEVTHSLSPLLLIISTLLEPDCIVISGTCPTFLASEIISRMNLFGDTLEHKFDYPLTQISPSKVGKHLNSYSASMIPIYHATSI